jgi:hypothetical protein
MAAPADRPHAPLTADQHFPQDLHVRGPTPHLAVRECSQSGVRLAFDSIWLEHEGFRASLPVRNAFSNTPDKADLLARPLAFIDRSSAAIRSVQELESRYEQHLLPGWSALDLLHVMGNIEALPRPFNNPMPYYLSLRHAHRSLECMTHRRPDGGITCEVVMPSGRYALDWVANVNGLCRPEYRLLEQELGLSHTDRWTALPETCRHRIEVWCRFRPRERYINYFNDADFGHRDMGLAGLVVTDRRLIYHKYHHGGEAPLNEEGLLLVREVEGFCHLTLQTPDRHTKLIKLAPPDLPALLEAVRAAPDVRVIVSHEK